MASYRKRNGKWEYRIKYRDPATGKIKEKMKSGFSRKADCVEAAAEMEKKIKHGHFNNDASVMFHEYALKWLKDYASNNKPSTVRPREIEYRRLAKHFGYAKINQITSIQYQDYLNSLNEKYATNTISGTHSTARMIFKRAYQDNLIDRDPTLYAKLPKKIETAQSIQDSIYNKRVKIFSREEISLFLHTAKTQGLNNDFEIFSLLVNTGMRVGELCALQENALLKKENGYYIRITQTIYNPTNKMDKYQLLPPKTKGSIRDIEISYYIYELIRKQIIKQKELYIALGGAMKRFIFSKDFGYPETPKQIANRMRRILKLCDLPSYYSPHNFRHSYASILEEEGVPTLYIQKQLGHSTFETTKETYIHLTEKTQKEASEKVLNIAESLSSER